MISTWELDSWWYDSEYQDDGMCVQARAEIYPGRPLAPVSNVGTFSWHKAGLTTGTASVRERSRAKSQSGHFTRPLGVTEPHRVTLCHTSPCQCDPSGHITGISRNSRDHDLMSKISYGWRLSGKRNDEKVSKKIFFFVSSLLQIGLHSGIQLLWRHVCLRSEEVATFFLIMPIDTYKTHCRHSCNKITFPCFNLEQCRGPIKHGVHNYHGWRFFQC